MKRFTLLLVAATSMATCSSAALAQTPPNPYGIAGWGQLARLEMPADCLDYDWNGLHPGTLVQMCRPNHYYDYIGIAPRWWGYNQETGEINDPARFSDWIAANPGRIWIIGNEPDLASQDGLTREQYARMFKTYHDFISIRDPAARFCIGAITGGSTPETFTATRAWYQYVLDFYETTYGEPMPIDIWNIHSYVGPLQIEDPDQPIRDFVQPFVNWCHTVEGGRYGSAEVWITELPVGEWMGALSQPWIEWFARRYLPRLEQAGVDRWFWFVSRSGDEFSNVGLVNSDNTISPLGETYGELARSYPNPVPPVDPFQPQPPPKFLADSFASGEIPDPWMIKAGIWSPEDGAVRQSRLDYPWNGEVLVLQHRYGDFHTSLKMRVNSAGNDLNWAGLMFRGQGRFHSAFNSGYLVYLRKNGTIGLFNKDDGAVREVPGAVDDASQYQAVRVQMEGWRIRVWLDNALLIDWTDTNQRYPEGYLGLQAHKTDCSYRDVHISSLPDAPSVEQPPLTLSTNTLTATWSCPPPWGVSEVQYAVGTSRGADDVRQWTPAEGTQLLIENLSMQSGQTCYVSVKLKDSDGHWSAVGSGQGTVIAAPTGMSAVAVAKLKLDGELVEPFTGIVSAGNDAFGSYLYVQDFQRSSGIRVTNPDGVPTNSIVSVAGVAGRAGRERCIVPSSLTVRVPEANPAVPLVLAARQVGGADWNPEGIPGAGQVGVAGCRALNNVGLLISVQGRVRRSAPTMFTIWDYSAWDLASPPIDPFGANGILVSTRGIMQVSDGEYVRATGISSLINTPSGPLPMVLIRTAADVQVLAPAP